MSQSEHPANTTCDVCPALIHLYSSLSLLLDSFVSLFATLFYSSSLLLSFFWPLLYTPLLSLPLSSISMSVPFFLPPLLSSPLLSPAVPIRRNLIGNQSFWWKNGVGLSVTIPWVLPAERGVQKGFYAGTVEGKVNVADSLSRRSLRVS